jgi:hypothetical protein
VGNLRPLLYAGAAEIDPGRLIPRPSFGIIKSCKQRYL